MSQRRSLCLRMALSGDALTFALTAAGSAIAFWVLVRFPRAGPQSVTRAALHVGAALACGQLVRPAIDFLAMLPGAGDPLLALLAGALPPLVYFLLSLGWLMRAIQRVGVYS